MRSRTIDLDGPVHYADFGGTGPTLVLVHGLGGSHVNWLAVAPVLARRARVLAVDLAGFGRPPLGERSADVHANRVLLDRFLDAVAAGPAVLVGNSMGELVAMMEAALAPERVAGLVLVAPAQPRSAEARVDGTVGPSSRSTRCRSSASRCCAGARVSSAPRGSSGRRSRSAVPIPRASRPTSSRRTSPWRASGSSTCRGRTGPSSRRPAR